MKMTTSTRQVGGVTIVDISGRIELGEESAALRDLICDLLNKAYKQILLNLGDVNYIGPECRVYREGFLQTIIFSSFTGRTPVTRLDQRCTPVQCAQLGIKVFNFNFKLA